MNRPAPAHADAIPAFMEWEPPTAAIAPVWEDGEIEADAWQAGRCGICGAIEFEQTRRAHSLDHDHGTGLVRGLLCTACNLAEGRDTRGAYGRWRTGMNPCAVFGWHYLHRGRQVRPQAITAAMALEFARAARSDEVRTAAKYGEAAARLAMLARAAS